MARYMIAFERGGCFELEFDPAAPKTAEAFRRLAEQTDPPYQALVLQGRFSGEEMYFPAPLGTLEDENNIAPGAGCIAFNSNPDWSAICMYWGDDLAEKKHYFNLFARVKGDPEEFHQVGIRVWQKGGELVTLKVID